MIKMINQFLFLTLSLTVCISCGKGDDPAGELPDWNKNRTATIQLYSRLNNEPLFNTADYSQVLSSVRSNLHQVAVLHRADVVYGTAAIVNPTISIASEAGKVPFFARNRYSGDKAEGSGVLIGHTVSEMKTIPISSGCSWFSVPTRANLSIAMIFATVTFDNESQLSPGAEVIRKNLNDGTVLVGVVSKTLKDKLASEFSAGSYRFEIVESTGNQVNQLVFVLTTLKWVLRQHTETPVGTDGVLNFNLQIESL